jgi:LuxR family maltose regulon positive regulatory protein
MTPNLTLREEEVMQNLRDGLTNETIASRMGITRDSVKLHLKNIFAKFGVGDRISALREAITRGFLR